MKFLLAILLVVSLAFGAFAIPEKETEAAPPSGSVTAPVTGTGSDGGTFTGNFEITRFASQGGQLFAVGDLTGTYTNALGVATPVAVENVRMPVQAQQGMTCEILNLTLGPLDLDLLGLIVHLDQVHLEITAEQGPGNLLGNLLCAIAGLLDSQTSPNALAQLLNRVLSIIG
jgi:hypothetical protein